MTEKRYYQRDFEELYYIIDSNVISEKEFDEKVDYDGYSAFEDSLTGEEIVDLLNENEQLKKQHRELQIEYNDACGIIHDLRENKLDLEDENEQLKQTMQEVAELLSEEVDLFSDKATEYDICAYVELKELDNKDAYYMAISTKKAIKMLKGDVE